MAHLETERLAREARHEALRDEATVGFTRCPECDALAPIHVPETSDDIVTRGVCRCICGMVFEVSLEPAA